MENYINRLIEKFKKESTDLNSCLEAELKYLKNEISFFYFKGYIGDALINTEKKIEAIEKYLKNNGNLF